jgi:2'-5' RNA ligase
MPSEPLRLFIAVPAPETVRASAAAVAEALRGRGDVRWVTPERLHLTLKFLGTVEPEKVEGIRSSLAKTANGFSSFVIDLTGPGAFPNPRRPQTLWLGVGGEGNASLASLAEAVDAAMSEHGCAREDRPFRGHLTIGRVRSPTGLPALSRALKEQIERGRPQEGIWPVGHFELVRSDLRPDGPVYTTIDTFGLKNTA